MWVVFKKEVQTFFSSLMAYVVIGFYLIVTGMMLWVFPDYSILEFPYASLEPYFSLAPYLLAMLIPAITMRSFAEEIQQGTFELLLTKPITVYQLILGKYLANLFLAILTILPSLVYYYSLKSLAASPSSLDHGEIMMAYFALVLLAALFTAGSVFSSALTSNQIVAFLIGVIICFSLHFAFPLVSRLPILFGGLDYLLVQIGSEYHYTSLSRGVLDLKDAIYFSSWIFLFLLWTNYILDKKR